MPTAILESGPQALLQPPRKRWTRAECEVLEEAGLLSGKFELIEGELIDKMGKKRPHVNSVTLIRIWLDSVFGSLFVNSEAPIDVSNEDNPISKPEPDLMVLRYESTRFRETMPGPADLVLVIEVADTSLAFDLGVKAGLYARGGIQDYWVLDIAGRRMIVHRDPRDGRYASVAAYAEHERVAPLAAPGSSFLVRDAFPG